MAQPPIPLWLDCDPGHDVRTVHLPLTLLAESCELLSLQIRMETKAKALGFQDAFAILLAAYHPAIKLLGISTVFGNASLQYGPIHTRTK